MGHRPELAAGLLRDPSAVDFVEIVAETCFARDRAWREAVALSELWPVVPHGIKLSLGSAEGIDADRASELGRLARAVRAPVITEHVALTTAAGTDIGHLTPVPRCPEVVRAVARNVAAARRRLPDVPFYVENIATPFPFPSDTMSEPDFYREITRATGCGLLLDVANLYANARNSDADPLELARAFPLEDVGMIHIAGGVFEHGFYFDTHAHAVPDAVYDVLAVVLERAPDVPIVLERDAALDEGLAPRREELDRAQQLRPSRDDGAEPKAVPSPANAELGSESPAWLVKEQVALMRLLTEERATTALAEAIGEDGVRRARSVLFKKRVDESLPLLHRLKRRYEDIARLAEAAVRDTARSPRMQPLFDARAIATAAKNEPTLAMDAARDLAELTARFAFPSETARARGALPSARRGPFVAREDLPNGRTLWAMKSFGVLARVHLRER